VDNRGFFLTWQALRSQLAAMPNELYLVRLIHNQTGRPFPGERLWTAGQLMRAAIIRFLRVRNGEGCDVYIQPYAANQNAGYILVDLDRADSTAVVDLMRANGHDPCVVVQTSPGHLQAWIRISTSPVEPAVATAVGRHLARTYGGDLASTDWRHLGRLAGFTNQKPQRRTDGDYAPWVRILHARAGLAPHAQALIETAIQGPTTAALPTATDRISRDQPPADVIGPGTTPPRLTTAEAAQVYRDCLQRWQILERFPQPDWSIVDLWIMRELLRQGRTVAEIGAVVRLASPHFPRGHGDPEDYLRRTLARAAFPAPGGAVCAPPGHAPLARSQASGPPRLMQDTPATQPTSEPGSRRFSGNLPAAGTQRWPTAHAPLPTLQTPSRGQALILADQVLNRLVGYARKGTRARRDFYQNDLNWLADVWLRLQTSEPDPLRPAGQ
jgi:RepB DNA-primase from phage plasmid